MLGEKFWKIGVILFWIAYGIFLLSSVPHLAHWFRHMDGTQAGIADWWYWVLAYGKAIAIDGADVLLTLAFLRLSQEEKNAGVFVKLSLIFLFILGFTGFSWYLNWQYEIQFMSIEYNSVDLLNNFLGGNVGTTNPVVGSAFNLFGLVFTLIADTLLKKTKVITAQELQVQLEDLEAKQKVQKQLSARKRQIRNETIDGALSGLQHTVKRVVQFKEGETILPEDQAEESPLLEEETNVVDLSTHKRGPGRPKGSSDKAPRRRKESGPLLASGGEE